MIDFIRRIIDGQELQLQYAKYENVFFRVEYSYYIFIFLKKENQLIDLTEEWVNLYMSLKDSDDYREDMDKNTYCIVLKEVSEKSYYSEDFENGQLLIKSICLIENNPYYFKKNVLLYTPKMLEFASSIKDDFDSVCRKEIAPDSFERFKIERKKEYKYEFLTKLYIKIPFLKYDSYYFDGGVNYLPVEKIVEIEMSRKMNDFSRTSELLEKLSTVLQEDDEKLFDYLDNLQI